ncbi:hypothetical protein JCM15908A_03030 [Prevotella dentasini JCM 15908]
MKLTNTSNSIMNTLIPTLTAVMVDANTAPIVAIIKMIQVNAKAMACPAIILAKSRTIRANGFVKIPNISITGIRGTGTFNQVGTSGQNMSFQ